nr:MAG TPA: hypothetical protein [Caudoviricetes sp.]
MGLFSPAQMGDIVSPKGLKKDTKRPYLGYLKALNFG